MKHLTIDPHKAEPPTRDLSPETQLPPSVPEAKQTLRHPTRPGDDANASLFFVGTATTILYSQSVVSEDLTEMCSFGTGSGKVSAS